MSFTQSQFQVDMARGIQNKVGMLLDPVLTMNDAVREVLNEVNIRSTRRKASLVPNLLNGEATYAVPSDLHGLAIIDVPAQATRYDGEFNLVPSEQYARSARVGDISIDDYNGIRRLYINSTTPDSSTVVDRLSSLTSAGGGTWSAFGDATSIEVNTQDYIKGNGSLEFSITAAAGTTAGLVNTDLGNVDLSSFIGYVASAFANVRITSTTGITNFKLRLGSSAAAYHEYTVTASLGNTAFQSGWNILSFDLSTPTSTTGTPDASDIQYCALYMTKATSKVSEAGYLFNYLQARKGAYADVKYYSKFGWTSSAGVYKQSSDQPTDILVADSDEYDLFVKKARLIAADETDLPDNQIVRIKNAYDEAKQNYMMLNPSESKLQISTYWDFGTRDRNGEDTDDVYIV